MMDLVETLRSVQVIPHLTAQTSRFYNKPEPVSGVCDAHELFW